MGRPIKLTQSSTQDTGYASAIGGTIGAPQAVTGVYTIDFQYCDTLSTTHAHGFAYKQRSKKRFDVSDSTSFNGNTTVTLVNSTDGNIANLTAGQALVSCYGNATYQFFAQSISSHYVVDFNGNKFAYDIQRAADATYGNVATN